MIAKTGNAALMTIAHVAGFRAESILCRIASLRRREARKNDTIHIGDNHHHDSIIAGTKDSAMVP